MRGTAALAKTRPFRYTGAEPAAAQVCWWLTIVWHPDPRCIGAVAHVEDAGTALVIGRGSPVFSTSQGDEVTLADPHISRRALVISRSAACTVHPAWTCERPHGSSRLRAEGQDLHSSQPCLRVTSQEWESGIVFALADHVVLHVRRAPPPLGRCRSGADTALLGVSPAVAALRRAVGDAGATRDDVLLIGPTGCGKELVARALHDASPVRDGPWVAVNMAAIPPELAAASLFGARRGAYTGADAHRQGFFQQASGGTLFLDEIGDAPAALQPMLLRALQERQVQVVGGPSEAVDVRVVSAMERDPDDPAFPFRGALRHRLAAQELRMPTLAQRREDLGLLLLHFFEVASPCGELSWPPVPRDAPRWVRLLELFLAYPWLGNVRELQHAARQIAAASQGVGLTLPPALQQRLQRGGMDSVRDSAGTQAAIDEADAPPQSVSERGAGAARSPAAEPAPDPGTARPGRVRLADLDDEALFEAWVAAGCEVAELARRLGVSRSSVYRRVETSRRCRLAADVPLGELLNALDACRGDLEATAGRLAVSRRGLEARMRASGARTPRDFARPLK
jgi:two-component system nitrogen regulation response regulator GlnG